MRHKHPHEPHRWSRPHTDHGKLLVRPSGDVEALRRHLSSRGAELGDGIGSTGAFVLHAQEGRSEALADELLKAGMLDYAHPDVSYPMAANPGDTAWSDSLDDFQHGWDLQKGGTVSVAVLDSGCNTFTDFSTNVLAGRNVLNSSSNVTDNDSNSHGTASCSLIGADSGNGSTGGGNAGLGWGIKVVPVKVTSGGSITDANSVLGINWVRNSSPATIISMGYAGPTASTQALIDEVAAAWAAGLILCASAGNTDDTVTQYPAALEHVVAVCGGNSANRDRFFANLSGGSSYGSWTDAAGHIGISVNEAQRAYNRLGASISYQGTSSSCPALCAALALMWSFKPSATNAQILAALIAEADPVGSDWGSPPHPAYALNVYRAIDSLRTDTRRGYGIAGMGI